jgi:hypothetical protein
MCRIVAVILIWVGVSGAALAQLCPIHRPPKPVDSGFDNGSEPSARRSISGSIIYHDDLRKWFGLRPDAPICGQSELQLWTPDSTETIPSIRKQIEMTRGCTATITGRLSFADLTDRARVIQLEVDRVVPDSTCTPKADLPDSNKLRPDAKVQKYVVTMAISLVGDGSVRVLAQAQKRNLYPWQGYATYSLSEGHIISATCGYGFVVSNVSGSPVAAFKNVGEAVIDIKSVPHDPTSHLSVTYTCTRVAVP